MDSIIKHHIKHNEDGCKALDLNRRLASSISAFIAKNAKTKIPSKLTEIEAARAKGEKKLKKAVSLMCEKSIQALARLSADNDNKAQMAISSLNDQIETFHQLTTELTEQLDKLHYKMYSTLASAVDIAGLVAEANYDAKGIKLIQGVEEGESTHSFAGHHLNLVSRHVIYDQAFYGISAHKSTQHHSPPFYVEQLVSKLQGRLAPLAENYTFDGTFGIGGQGKVFRGKCSSDSANCYAIKVEEICQASFENRIREAWLTSSDWIRHDNILSCLKCSIFSSKGTYYMMLQFEHMTDHNFSDYICEDAKDGEGCLKEPQMACIFQQTLQGLNYLHKHKIIHNDVKPPNILLHNGAVKLSDFGRSCYLAEYSTDIIGTPYYTAPEIAAAILSNDKTGKMATFGIDIWALGITVYSLLEAKNPFNKQNKDIETVQIFQSITKTEISLSKETNCSSSMRQFLSLCTNKDPASRPSAEMLLYDPFIASACTPKQLAKAIKLKRAKIKTVSFDV